MDVRKFQELYKTKQQVGLQHFLDLNREMLFLKRTGKMFHPDVGVSAQ